MTARVRAGKRSSLEPQSLSIALLDWTICDRILEKVHCHAHNDFSV